MAGVIGRAVHAVGRFVSRAAEQVGTWVKGGKMFDKGFQVSWKKASIPQLYRHFIKKGGQKKTGAMYESKIDERLTKNLGEEKGKKVFDHLMRSSKGPADIAGLKPVEEYVIVSIMQVPMKESAVKGETKLDKAMESAMGKLVQGGVPDQIFEVAVDLIKLGTPKAVEKGIALLIHSIYAELSLGEGQNVNLDRIEASIKLLEGVATKDSFIKIGGVRMQGMMKTLRAVENTISDLGSAAKTALYGLPGGTNPKALAPQALGAVARGLAPEAFLELAEEAKKDPSV